MGWLELFYDLVYVAAIIQLGQSLSRHPDAAGVLAFAGVFTAMWLAWTDFTFYANRFVVDDLLHRGLVFVQMFAVGGVAVTVPDVVDGELAGFFGAMAAIHLLRLGILLRTWLQVREHREAGTVLVAGAAAVAILWGVAWWAPLPWSAGAATVAVAVDVVVKLAPGGRLAALAERHPPDGIHLSERYGLLTLIVLGESFVKLLDAASTRAITPAITGMAALALSVTFSLWWLYFDDVAGSRIRRTRLASTAWVWAHLPLAMGITAVGVAVKKVVFLDPSQPAPESARVLLSGALAVALASMAAIDAVTVRRASQLTGRNRLALRLFGVALVVAVGATTARVPLLTFLGLVGGVCVVQVLADLAMAPSADPGAAEREDPALWEPLIPAGGGGASPGGARAFPAALRHAVRRGVPSPLRSDLYHHLMDGSWTRMFAVIAVTWVLSNVFFGALYMLEPGSVSAVHDDSFLEAFSFSVQTMASIGYGVFAPQTEYAHLVVAVEALVGLIGIALATGLVFAKASRPTMAVMFSRVAVVHLRQGSPTLEFRIANARGTEVVEATVNVAALVDEVSEEGHAMRRLHDLELVRSTTPMFALSWSVMHRLEGTSPLAGLARGEAPDGLRAIICTLTGHDATYGQTTHARHIYAPDSIRFDESFVDMIGTLPDGRMLVDFTRIHDTRPAPRSLVGR